MSYANDTLEDAARRLHSAASHNTTIDVFVPTESLTAADGVDVSYPATATNSGVPARYVEPSDATDRDEGGTTADLDAVIYVRDDARSQWDGFGESGEAAARVEDAETSQQYQIQQVSDAKDGRVRLGCVEV